MQSFFKDIRKFTRTRKFWIAVFGAVVTYLVAKFGNTDEITLLTGLGTALGVWGATND